MAYGCFSDDCDSQDGSMRVADADQLDFELIPSFILGFGLDVSRGQIFYPTSKAFHDSLLATLEA